MGSNAEWLNERLRLTGNGGVTPEYGSRLQVKRDAASIDTGSSASDANRIWVKDSRRFADNEGMSTEASVQAARNAGRRPGTWILYNVDGGGALDSSTGTFSQRLGGGPPP